MIIASPAKKDLAIPMQVLQSAAPASDDLHIPHEYCGQDHEDVVTFTKRDFGATNDFVGTVFGRLSRDVDRLMLIKVYESNRLVQCQAFIHGNTVFLTSPLMENSSNWNDGEFQPCITRLIELAEEKTGCEYLVIAINRKSCTNSNSNPILRAFMYLGFQMVNPSVYNQSSDYILVGYEL
ncbi:hypothetical protein BX666DRAFT_1897494 [Dichotomocladium elegans]|nr:hypothetical protein BX666DRAFT_1897494 [Dichotomocladium elegans]